MKIKNCLLLMLVSVLYLPPLSAQPLDGQALQQALLATERDVADRVRDSSRKPLQVLEFLGLQRGMQTLDLYAASGYYTYIIAKAIGPSGTVFAQNAPHIANYEDNIGERPQSQALAAMVEATGLNNVQALLRPSTDLGLAPNSIDFVLISQILHDYYNTNPQRAHQLLQHLYQIVKPGGIVGIIDHVGVEGADNRRMHRMTIDDAHSLVLATGFIIEAESSVLRNPQDSHRRSIFDPILNRQTDQFLLRLRKPLNNTAH